MNVDLIKIIEQRVVLSVLLIFFASGIFIGNSVDVFAQGISEQLVSAVPAKNPELVKGIEAALKGDVKEAETAFAEEMKKSPGSRPGGIDAAMAFTDPAFEGKQFGKLRFWLEKAAEDFPDDPEAFLLLANIAFSEGRYLECSMLTRHAAELVEKFNVNPDRQRALRLDAEKLFANVAEQRERWDEAEKHSAKLHELDPTSGEPLYRLGLAQYRLGKKDEAVKSLTKAASKDSRIPVALIVLAQLAEYDDKTDDSQKMVDEALAQNGENPKVLLAAADLELKWNRMAKVKELAEKAQKLDPKSTDAVMTLGILDLYNGKFEDAEDKFHRLLEVMPNNTKVMTGLALALSEQTEQRQLRRAFTLAKLNADNNPNSVDAQTTLAWVLIKFDALDDAEKILKRLFDAGDLNSPGAYYMAVLYSDQKRTDDAIRFLESALETKVNFPKRIAAEALLKTLKEDDAPKPE